MTKTYMRSIGLAIAFICIGWNISCGQIISPAIEAESGKGYKILGGYNPNKKFLKGNPTYLSQGEYFVDLEQKGYKNLKWGNRNYFRFGSNDFPCTIQPGTSSDRKLGAKLVVFFTNAPNQYDGISFNPDNGGKPFIIKEYSQSLGLSSLQQQYFKARMDNLLNDIVTVVDKRFQDSVIYHYPFITETNYEINSEDIILEFQYEQTNAYFNIGAQLGLTFGLTFTLSPFIGIPVGKVSKLPSPRKVPGNLLFTLNVKSSDGKLIKSYGQAIFFSTALNGYWKSHTRLEAAMFEAGRNQAMESLLNRFTGDTSVIGQIHYRNYLISEIMSINEDFKKVLIAKGKVQKYTAMRTRLEGELVVLQNKIKQNLRDMRYAEQMRYAYTGSNEYSSIASAINSSASAIMMSNIQSQMSSNEDRVDSKKKALGKAVVMERQALEELLSITKDDETLKQLAQADVDYEKFLAEYEKTSIKERQQHQKITNISRTVQGTMQNITNTIKNAGK